MKGSYYLARVFIILLRVVIILARVVIILARVVIISVRVVIIHLEHPYFENKVVITCFFKW